jgi:geranylgeranyl diphosphate synthase, type II
MRANDEGMRPAEMLEYMQACRTLVLEELRGFVPGTEFGGEGLYELIFDYPLRDAKALRPALCIATCRALGGSLEGVLKSAAVVELYHNAFLIHDDIEDGSELRRGQPTLHASHGTGIAVNVGDAMLALALEPLLENMRDLGMGKALRILQAVSTMARESAEGQAMELSWIRSGRFNLEDRAYLRMVHKKTAWYSFITPMVLGGIVAGAPSVHLGRVRRFAICLGAAFQIQDDILNLTANEARYGKEFAGDLWEGKHTLILLHAVRSATPVEQRRALEVLGKPRPPLLRGGGLERARQTLQEMLQEPTLAPNVRARLRDTLSDLGGAERYKTEEDVAFLLELIRRRGSIEHARAVAQRRAERARQGLSRMSEALLTSEHSGFLRGLVHFVIERDH